MGNVDAEEMDWGGELRQILVSRQTGDFASSTNMEGNRVYRVLRITPGLPVIR